MSSKIGAVTRERYEQLVQRGRELVKDKTISQFKLGDCALEIEPLRPNGGAHPAPGEGLRTVEENLRDYAEQVGVPYRTLDTYRWVAAHWPGKYRRPQVSYFVHKVFISVTDEQHRFWLIDHPKANPRTGEARWTIDMAKREVGWQPETPLYTQEKVNKATDLVEDDEVAVKVATGLLHRPNVAFRAMSDDTARHQVNRAQMDIAHQAGEVARDRTPPIARMEHTSGFVELIGACHAFTAAIGRILPDLRGHEFTEEERATVHRNIAKVRSTADWLDTAVDTEDVSIDEGLASILRGD